MSKYHFSRFLLPLFLLNARILNIILILNIEVWHHSSLVIGQPTNYI